MGGFLSSFPFECVILTTLNPTLRQRLTKADLIALVQRQPRVLWPTRVCTYKDIERVQVKHLKKALTGSYGYHKGEVLDTNVGIGLHPSLSILTLLSFRTTVTINSLSSQTNSTQEMTTWVLMPNLLSRLKRIWKMIRLFCILPIWR